MIDARQADWPQPVLSAERACSPTTALRGELDDDPLLAGPAYRCAVAREPGALAGTTRRCQLTRSSRLATTGDH